MDKTDTRNKPNAKFNSTTRLYAILDYNYILFPLTLLATYYAFYKFVQITEYYYITPSETNDWNWATAIHIILTGFFLLSQCPPYAHIWGLCVPMRPFKYAEAPKQRKFGVLRVCLVTKGSNFQTVLNSASHWDNINYPNVHFHIVVDGQNGDKFRDALPSYIYINEIPASFQPKKAKYKARVLEYFRRTQNLDPDDWVLHLDEEAEIDGDVIRVCLDFIERGTAHVGMGTTHYNSFNHWTNPFLSTVEVNRVAEDFGRFQLPVRLFQRPLLGWMHGSFILINGAVENSITWDVDCVAEDFWFAYQAASKGYKFGWLHAIAHEQPPCTFRDFFRQRRRWYSGILSIDNTLVRMSQVANVTSVLCLFCFPLANPLGYKIPIPKWYFNILLWNDAANAHVLMVASVLQDMTVAGVSWVGVMENAVKAVVLTPFVQLVQAVALVSCLVVPEKGFRVISKI